VNCLWLEQIFYERILVHHIQRMHLTSRSPIQQPGNRRGNRSPLAPIMIVRDLRTFAFASLSGQPFVALIRKRRKVIMNLLLFVMEIFLIVAAIGLVPARSELRISRARVIHNEREQENSLRS
jgi:hypothetical protein